MWSLSFVWRFVCVCVCLCLCVFCNNTVAGTLTVMLGGDEAAQVTVRPLLAAFASNIVSAGSTPGAGHALKGINNLLKYSFNNLLLLFRVPTQPQFHTPHGCHRGALGTCQVGCVS
jgi:hypothetical protein